jgi:hypothetical protein
MFIKNNVITNLEKQGKQRKFKVFNKIGKLQIRAARTILNKTSRIRNQDILKELGWMSFNERYNFHIGILIYKACNNLAT